MSNAAQTRIWGCHVSSAGGLEKSLDIAKTLEINAIQIHPCPPQKWNVKPFADGVESKFNSHPYRENIKKVFFHGIYLINLANPDPVKKNLAKLSLVHDLELNHKMHADGVIFHVGSMKDEPDDLVGLSRAAETINRVLSEAKGNSKLLLEVAAGSGKVIGAKMEELAEIYSRIENKERVGFALDTQHLWASGYNVKDKLDFVVAEAERIFTLEKVFAIHLNDSKTALASKTDRHENIGDGQIGLEGMTNVVNHPKLKNIPMILETPAMKDLAQALGEVEKVRGLVK